nr:ABC transporter ATP-binding protein [Clavibacter sp. VKM Ac-2872]
MEPREHADRASSAEAEELAADTPAAGEEHAPTTVAAAVPRPPRPGQRVPRRATAPSPRTAPAVVVAPTPPRVKSAPVAPAASRPSGGAGEDGGDASTTTGRAPRVRRRTRVQRAAGSAEAVPAAGSGTTSAPEAESHDDAVPAQPDQDGLSELRGMFAEPEPEPEPEPASAEPASEDRAEPEAEPEAETEPLPGPEAEADLDAEPLADVEPVAAPEEEDAASALEPAPADHPASASDVVAHAETAEDPAPDPSAEPATDDGAPTGSDTPAPVDAEVLEEVDAAATPLTPERPADEPASPAEPASTRAVTVRTDSLTAPRSPRPGLAGMAETALTPSVRGDRAAAPELGEDVLVIDGLTKRFDEKVAVDDIALTVRAGSFYGIVGPNGAGKTTTMSMVTGLLRPDAGTVTVNGIDVWREPLIAKRSIGVLPDRLRLFDRLTGAQLLHYSGALRGLDDAEIRSRSADLIAAFGLEDAVGRLVTDYSAGMTKKVALACAMIHSPRMLVLDEPFESVDPVSAANVVEILQDYVAHGGTVVLSSHGMDFIQRICDHVAIIVNGRVLAAGTMDEVRAGRSLEERFVALAGGRRTAEGFSWLHSFSD